MLRNKIKYSVFVSLARCIILLCQQSRRWLEYILNNAHFLFQLFNSIPQSYLKSLCIQSIDLSLLSLKLNYRFNIISAETDRYIQILARYQNKSIQNKKTLETNASYFRNDTVHMPAIINKAIFVSM